LDALADEPILSREEFAARFGVDMSEPTLLATFHPETRRGPAGLVDAETFAGAIAATDRQIILTLPNADTYGGATRERLLGKLATRPRTHIFEMLGRAGYYSALAHCEMVVGNSSSGI